MFSIIFWGSEKLPCFFFVVFQASTEKKLRGKNHEKNPRTLKFDAKHSAVVAMNSDVVNGEWILSPYGHCA